jgi:hypothetical protein
MPRSLFAAFRSADGRSFARALAVLVIVSSVFGGMAAAGAATTANIEHCIDTPFGTLPNGHDSLACCPAMTGGTPLLPPPAAPAIGLPLAADIAIVPIPRDLWIPESPIAPSDRPRGPPLTA